MATITTYDELKTGIKDWLDRSDLDDYVDTFIDLAEARFKREIRIRETLQVNAAITISEDDRTIDIASNTTRFLDHKYLRLLVPDGTLGRRFMPNFQETTLHEMTNYSINEQKCPEWYTVWPDGTVIELDAPADQDYTAELFYYQELVALDDTNTTNALLDRAPDAYLWGSLAATAPFLQNDERVNLWETLYGTVRDDLSISEREMNRGGPLIARVGGRRKTP